MFQHHPYIDQMKAVSFHNGHCGGVIRISLKIKTLQTTAPCLFQRIRCTFFVQSQRQDTTYLQAEKIRVPSKWFNQLAHCLSNKMWSLLAGLVLIIRRLVG
jgi:hypothetical protein